MSDYYYVGANGLNPYAGLAEGFAKPYIEYYEAVLKTKYIQTKKTGKVLGVSGVSFNEISVRAIGESGRAANALTETLDTTTYPDKAILKLYNGRGFDVYLRSMTLQGKRIMQYSGEMGELIHDSLKRDDDIRRNGESTFEVGNEYIVTADQCARIADYWYKFLGKKKHLYSLQIPGLAAWYNVGDWYNLQVGEADTNEYIDAVVECYAVDVERVAGTIGSTTLLLRDVEDNWSKTTLYAARLATGGSPKRRVNRSNIVTVASSEYDGTYDWRCDGTDDDVQIQAAIDYLSNTHGGGTVALTNGAYTLGATLTMKTNVILKGVGNSTILYPESASVTTMIDFGTATGSSIEDFTVDGDGANITFITNAMNVIDGQTLGTAKGITVQNYVFSNTSGIKAFVLFYELNTISCNSKTNQTDNTGTSSNTTSFYSCTNVASCSCSGNTTTGSSAYHTSFTLCLNISSCSSSGNSTAGASARIRSFRNCTNISSCSSSGNSTAGSSAHVESFYLCTNASSCSSSANSVAGASAVVIGYSECTKITVCSTSGNTSALSVTAGFDLCKSVQQCKSSGDTTPYSNSYADAGTTDPCSDAAVGGYNS